MIDRKQELRRLMAKTSPPFPLQYADHVRQTTVLEREQSTWYKILNREYSQKDGREDLFERERHSEPVPGWHSCAIACAELEEAIG